MSRISTNGKSLFIARHGETVFNAAGRIQGESLHTPLTRAGIAQAEGIGDALRAHIGPHRPVILCASDTGRALQTLSIIAEHIDHDWHETRQDARLREIEMGDWSGRYYHELGDDLPKLIDKRTGLFRRIAPRGESCAAIAARLTDWIEEQSFDQDMLIIMHGISSRILRGLLCAVPIDEEFGVGAGPALPQGSIVRIIDGVEEVVHQGTGRIERA